MKIEDMPFREIEVRSKTKKVLKDFCKKLEISSEGSPNDLEVRILKYQQEIGR